MLVDFYNFLKSILLKSVNLLKSFSKAFLSKPFETETKIANTNNKNSNIDYKDEIMINDFYPNFNINFKYFLELLDYLQKIYNSDAIKGYFKQIKGFNEQYGYLSVAKESDFLPLISVVGSFSCGKSAFINSMFEKEFCPIDVNPTTHSVSVFKYGKKLKITDSNKKKYTEEQYKNLLTKENTEVEDFYIEYPCEILKKIRLGDSPGILSVSTNVGANKRDSELAKYIISNSKCVLFLLDITRGTIKPEEIDLYNETKQLGKIIYVILTHGDKRPPNKRENIKKHIQETLKIYDNEIFIYSSLLGVKEESKIKEKDKPYFKKQRSKIIELLTSIKKEKTNLKKEHENFKLNYKQFVKRILNMIPQYIDYLDNNDKIDFYTKKSYTKKINYYKDLLNNSI